MVRTCLKPRRRSLWFGRPPLIMDQFLTERDEHLHRACQACVFHHQNSQREREWMTFQRDMGKLVAVQRGTIARLRVRHAETLTASDQATDDFHMLESSGDARRQADTVK